MAYTNHLLFNNIFLRNLHPTEEEIASANYLVLKALGIGIEMLISLLHISC
jgi:hypothetical protein